MSSWSLISTMTHLHHHGRCSTQAACYWWKQETGNTLVKPHELCCPRQILDYFGPSWKIKFSKCKKNTKNLIFANWSATTCSSSNIHLRLAPWCWCLWLHWEFNVSYDATHWAENKQSFLEEEFSWMQKSACRTVLQVLDILPSNIHHVMRLYYNCFYSEKSTLFGFVEVPFKIKSLNEFINMNI